MRCRDGELAPRGNGARETARPPPLGNVPAARAANSDGQGAALVTDSVSRRLPRGVKGSCKPQALGNASYRLARVCLSRAEFTEWVASQEGKEAS
jgi:hypothetical protein